jgi:glutamate carboxypeptidase
MRVGHFEARLPEMLADLEELVRCESPSADAAALARSADAVDALGRRLLGAPAERIVRDGRPHLRWTFGEGPRRVLLLGHHDTVWPLGTLDRLPWTLRDGVVRGPGCFDMKAGLVQMFYALAALEARDGVTVLVTADEEVGSPSSEPLIADAARGCAAALVLEASAPGGALKTARKGVSRYELTVRGRAAHAGLEPERGVNATVEIAHQVPVIAGLADGDTTVTPTLLTGGSSANTVPDRATLAVDVRMFDPGEQRRVDAALRGLRPRLPGAALELTAGPRRPPLPASASAGLFALARRVAADLGLGDLAGVAVGGGSDGNLAAAVGTPTLDGLGAVGGGAHADEEHVVAGELPRRAALLANLVTTLLGEGADVPPVTATGPRP